ncbi:MAG: peptidylprolyl isomerase [Bacilli bacterium]|nr:peptidylprolyl isomerase [Bacilli bacterium]
MNTEKATKSLSTILIIVGIIIIVIIAFFAVKENNYEVDYLNINFEVEENKMNLEQYNTTNPVVAMEIENYGAIVIELYPEVAPNTVNNFISLVQKGFYDNNTFHRLVPGFVLQGGDPEGQGSGGPGYHIKGEFAANGFNNDLKHTEGIISMARSSSYDSAGSQFFIMLGTATHLDGQYAAFGKVIDGMDNVRYIAANETIANTQSGKLVNNLTIKKAVVDLKGKTYQEVEKVTE